MFGKLQRTLTLNQTVMVTLLLAVKNTGHNAADISITVSGIPTFVTTMTFVKVSYHTLWFRF